MKRFFAAFWFLLLSQVAHTEPLPAGQFILASPDVATFTARMGHAPSVVMYSVNWNTDAALNAYLADPGNVTLIYSPFSDQISTLDLVHAAGATPWLGWGLPIPGLDVPVPQQSIVPNVNEVIAGTHDTYITDYLTEIKTWGKELWMAFLPEFNNYGETSFGASGFDAGINTLEANLSNQYGDASAPDGPERIRDAILHVIGIAETINIPNLKFFMYGSSAYMVPEISQFSDESGYDWNRPQYYYAGDNKIHAIGQSNHFTTLPEFNEYLNAGLDAWSAVTTKPFLLVELGFENVAGDRSAQITEVFKTVLPTKPRVQSVAIVDSQFSTAFGTGIGGDSNQYPAELSLYQSYLSEIRLCEQVLNGRCFND